MADLVITPSSVQVANTITQLKGIAGEAIDAGELVYVDSTDSNKIKLADASALATADTVGIAVNTAEASGQSINYVKAGAVTVGAVVTVGQVYVVSATAGKIAPYADLVTGNYVSIVGVGTSSSQITFVLDVSGVAKP